MKYLYAVLMMTLPIITFSQETINGTLMHNGVERAYIMQIPASYTGDTPVPLVFNFHGYTSNAFEQSVYGSFLAVAATENFITVMPEGLELNGSTHWNVGGWTVGSTSDDVGFTAAMIEEFDANYNINTDRVYATGMSNGGYLSYRLACELGDKIAAIASVTGTMTKETFDNCNPTHPTPIMEIHGTSDLTVPYDGGLVFNIPVVDVMDYWVDYNNCDTDPQVIEVFDTNTSDGCTATHFIYSGCDKGITNEHFRINDGGHTWPGAFFEIGVTNQDINASAEIWKFFSRYDINGPIADPTDVKDLDDLSMNVYPNPATDLIHLTMNNQRNAKYELYSDLGKLVLSGEVTTTKQTIDISNLANQTYILKVGNQAHRIVKID